MRAKRCKTCKYAESVIFIDVMMDAGYFGYCHRYPPLRKVNIDDGSFEGYNDVFDDDWCGEWRAKTIEKKLQRTTGKVRNSTVKDV